MRSRQDWADHLRTIAMATGAIDLQNLHAASSFTDERGDRVPTDVLLISHVLNTPVRPDRPAQNAPERLWLMACSRERALPDLSPSTPMLMSEQFGSIEVWTESLLSSLHALGWLAMTDHTSKLSVRVRRELEWILKHIEPDNATRRPWAIHLFVNHALAHNDQESMLYAEELLHVCQVSSGKPDKRSAWILADAAAFLDLPDSG